MKSILIFRLTRREVETLDLSRFIDTHGTWPMQRGPTLARLMDSLIIEVDGYDDDPREISTIPEVRTFFRRLYELWPWWSFFLHTGAKNLAIHYMCLLEDVQITTSASPGKTGYRYNVAELQVLLLQEFSYLNFLCDRAGMTDAQGDARSQVMVNMFVPAAHEKEGNQ